MKIHWTETAQAHLDAIHAYVSRDSPEYALRVVDRLTRRSQQIASFPLFGRKVPEFETESIREVIEGSYRIIYCVQTGRDRRFGRDSRFPGHSQCQHRLAAFCSVRSEITAIPGTRIAA